jgi:peptidase E
VEAGDLELFKSPNHENIREFLLSQDIIWVEGGSVDNLLAVWEVHGVYETMREAYEKGIILGGYSAGSECWSAGGTTMDLGPEPLPFINKKSLLPFSSGVHYDVDPQRQPLFHQLIKAGKIPAGYATEEGVSIHFVNEKLYKVISDRPEKAAYYIYKDENGELVEERLEPEYLEQQ